jgi:peptide/nickel transport system substrate-binding protein
MLRGAGVGAAGLAGAALIGCGGDEDEVAAPSAKATVKPVASTQAQQAATASAAATTAAAPVSKVTPGGILNLAWNDDPDTWDSMKAASFKTTQATIYLEQRLLKYDVGDGASAPGTLSGDAAESFEMPDELTTIFKLRKNSFFDDRAPTNGRRLTAEDVAASWAYYAAEAQYRSGLANAVNPSAPIANIEAIDDETVKLTSVRPDANMLPALNTVLTGMWLHPVEAHNGGYDASIADNVRGSGPFILENYVPSVSYDFRKNPKWSHGPDLPYVDGVHVSFIPEQIQAESQFKAGKFDVSVTGELSLINMPSILSQVDSVEPVLAMPNAGASAISTSYTPNDTGPSPFLDVRVRRAMSMGFDRDAFLKVTADPEAVRAAGIPMNTYVASPMSAGFGGYWLDPEGSNFGPSGKYLKFDPAEAAKMMAAAGHTPSNPIETTLILTPKYYRDLDTRSALVQALWKTIGINVAIHASDYTSEWVPEYLRAHGDYTTPGGKGGWPIAWHPQGKRADPGQWLQVFHHSTGSNNIVGETYPELDKLIDGQSLAVSDVNERIEKIHDIQRWMTENMTCVGNAQVDTVSLKHSWLHGPEQYGTYPGGFYNAAESVPLWWLDADHH